jgi:hypothetical protein
MKRLLLRTFLYSALLAASLFTLRLHLSNASLERQTSLPASFLTNQLVRLPQSAAAPADHPTWRPFQFNGETYYYVPLASAR